MSAGRQVLSTKDSEAWTSSTWVENALTTLDLWCWPVRGLCWDFGGEARDSEEWRPVRFYGSTKWILLGNFVALEEPAWCLDSVEPSRNRSYESLEMLRMLNSVWTTIRVYIPCRNFFQNPWDKTCAFVERLKITIDPRRSCAWQGSTSPHELSFHRLLWLRHPSISFAPRWELETTNQFFSTCIGTSHVEARTANLCEKYDEFLTKLSIGSLIVAGNLAAEYTSTIRRLSDAEERLQKKPFGHEPWNRSSIFVEQIDMGIESTEAVNSF